MGIFIDTELADDGDEFLTKFRMESDDDGGYDRSYKDQDVACFGKLRIRAISKSCEAIHNNDDHDYALQ